MNAKYACANNLISEKVMEELMQAKADKLAQCGLEDLNLKPDHLLISFDSRATNWCSIPPANPKCASATLNSSASGQMATGISRNTP